MSFDYKDVEKIAHLARLSVSDDKKDEIVRDLSNILALVEQLNEVDTSGVEPMAHPLAEAQRLREDKVSESNQREQFQASAPLVEKGLYLVPKVIE